MNIAMKGVGLLMLLLGAAVAWRGTQLGYINYRMPASGFFPFWDGLLLVVAGAALILSRRAVTAIPKDIDVRKQLTAVALVAGYLLAISVLGTVVATVIYFVVALSVVGRHRWPVVALCTGLSLAIIYSSFELWLHIPLARGIFDSY